MQTVQQSLAGKGPAGQALRATLADEQLAWEKTACAGIMGDKITHICLAACGHNFIRLKAVNSDD